MMSLRPFSEEDRPVMARPAASRPKPCRRATLQNPSRPIRRLLPNPKERPLSAGGLRPPFPPFSFVGPPRLSQLCLESKDFPTQTGEDADALVARPVLATLCPNSLIPCPPLCLVFRE